MLALLLPWPSDAAVPAAAKRHKAEFVAVYRQTFGPSYPAMLPAQIEAESAWIDGQTSTASARGLCQFIEPSAIGQERLTPTLAAFARYSPAWCARAQSAMMRDLLAAFGAGRGACSAFLFALAGYNGSPSTLRREIAQCAAAAGCDPSRWFEHVATMRARSWAFWSESRSYVLRVYSQEPDYAAEGWGVRICSQ